MSAAHERAAVLTTIAGAGLTIGLADAVAGLRFWASSASPSVPLAPLAACAFVAASALALGALALGALGWRVLPGLQGMAILGLGLWWIAQHELLRSRWFELEGQLAGIAACAAVGLSVWLLTKRVAPARLAVPVSRAWLAACAATAAVLAGTWLAAGGAPLAALPWASGAAAAVLAAWRLPRAGTALLGAAAILLAAGVVLEQREPELPPTSERTHSPSAIVLIVVDTLRRDALSCYEPDARPTPAIDALAADALVFDDARSAAPWTLPSMCSLLTGVSPLVHLALERESVLPDAVETLAARLSTQGYRTAAFGQNPFLQRRSGLGRGFERFAIYPRDVAGPPVGGKLLRLALPGAFSTFVPDARLTTEALDWLDRARSRDFFLWVHYFDPHAPYDPDPALLPGGRVPAGLPAQVDSEAGRRTTDERRRDWVRTLYAAEVQATDRAVGRLLDGLRAAGRYDDALIVLTSDHGEEFWEHGGFEHGHSYFDEVLRVPLIVKLPGGQDGRRVVTTVVNTAVPATILGAAGVEIPAGIEPALPTDGAAGAPGPWPLSGVIYGERADGVQRGSLKYWREARTGRAVVFDLDSDPGEQEPLVDEAARRELQAARERLEREAADHRASMGVSRSRLERRDERVDAQLRALGY